MNSYNDTRKVSCGPSCQQYTHLFPTPIADNKDAPAPTLCIAFVTIASQQLSFVVKLRQAEEQLLTTLSLLPGI